MKRLVVLVTALFVLTTAASAAPRGSAITVYLVHNGKVAPVRRTATGTPAPARASLELLLRGPSAAERRAGYSTAVPSGTRIRALALRGGVLTVDLTRRFESGGGSMSMLLRVAQVVHTATRFPSVARVSFRLDGTPVTAIGGEGVVVGPSVSRADFEAQAPRILVEQPLRGDRVSSPLVVRGSANVFEGQFLVDVVTPGGAIVAHRHVTRGPGALGRGPFEVRIAVARTAGRVVVVAYDRSPKDGSRIDEVRVPVSLR